MSGSNAAFTIRLLSTSESRLVDRRYYELDGGRWHLGDEVVEIEPLASTEPIEVPDSFDVERANCIGERLETSDYLEMSLLIEDFTTAQNSDLFTTCGFEFYPAGTDFRDD